MTLQELQNQKVRLYVRQNVLQAPAQYSQPLFLCSPANELSAVKSVCRLSQRDGAASTQEEINPKQFLLPLSFLFF
jgi:hypothetical protein